MLSAPRCNFSARRVTKPGWHGSSRPAGWSCEARTGTGGWLRSVPRGSRRASGRCRRARSPVATRRPTRRSARLRRRRDSMGAWTASSATSATSIRGRASGSSRSSPSSSSATNAARSATSRRSSRTRSRRRGGCRCRIRSTCWRTRASARWPARPFPAYDAAALYALNFYNPLVADQLRNGRKTATIRLGDKTAKYKKGQVVQVLVGARYGIREKIFDAVIDKVEVKALEDLSPREIEHDNPSIRRPEEMADFLSQLYNRDVSGAHAVTVIRFSAIKNS